MTELQVAGKKLLMPPSTMNTPTAMLTRRLQLVRTLLSPHADTQSINIQDVCEIHFDDFMVCYSDERDLLGLVVANQYCGSRVARQLQRSQ